MHTIPHSYWLCTLPDRKDGTPASILHLPEIETNSNTFSPSRYHVLYINSPILFDTHQIKITQTSPFGCFSYHIWFTHSCREPSDLIPQLRCAVLCHALIQALVPYGLWTSLSVKMENIVLGSTHCEKLAHAGKSVAQWRLESWLASYH